MPAFGFKDRAETTNSLSPIGWKYYDNSSPDQWRYIPTKLNPADKGTRGVFVQELIWDDCWWRWPLFLHKGEEEPWSERKYGKAPETFKEVKSVKRGRIEAVYPGQDGLIRMVDERTGRSVKCRPITGLSPLEAEGLSMSTLVTLVIYAFS